MTPHSTRIFWLFAQSLRRPEPQLSNVTWWRGVDFSTPDAVLAPAAK
jgi:hypothetical protein